MIEVKKAWKHEGFGGIAEGPHSQVWLGAMKIKIDQVERINPESEAFKQAVVLSAERFGQTNEDFEKWVKIQLAAKIWESRRIEICHADLHSENLLEHSEPPVAPKIERVPGFGFCRVVGSFFPRKFREQVLEAQLADAIEDYVDACKAGDNARMKRLRYMIPLWLVCAIFTGAIPMIFGWMKASVGTSKD